MGTCETRWCAPVSVVLVLDTVDFSSEIAMPLDSAVECAEGRGGLKTVSKLLRSSAAPRGDKSLDFISRKSDGSTVIGGWIPFCAYCTKSLKKYMNGVRFYEMVAEIKRHGVLIQYEVEDFEADIKTLRKLKSTI